MTLEEAKKIGDIVSTADGGCSYCIGNLLEYLQVDFPEFTWVIKDGTYNEVEVTVNG